MAPLETTYIKVRMFIIIVMTKTDSESNMRGKPNHKQNLRIKDRHFVHMTEE